MNSIEPTAILRAGSLKIKVYGTREQMGQAAAAHAARSLTSLAAGENALSIIFATGASQLATLSELTATPGLPWNKVIGFHMDEYLGISETHPASFRRYLRENLTSKVPMREFHGIDGTPANAERTCAAYSELLRTHLPPLCLLGIGENGHLAFNDPAEADFNDPLDAKIVVLDDVCRGQQFNEGWFPSLAAVPQRAISLTIPALFRVPELILSIPGPRKAHIVKRTLEERVSTDCPATILRSHPNATVYLDGESAAELKL